MENEKEWKGREVAAASFTVKTMWSDQTMSFFVWHEKGKKTAKFQWNERGGKETEKGGVEKGKRGKERGRRGGGRREEGREGGKRGEKRGQLELR